VPRSPNALRWPRPKVWPTPRDKLLGQLRRVVIDAERRELIRLWRENEIDDEVMRHQEELLDYQEAQL
jgi:hypothetical protein